VYHTFGVRHLYVHANCERDQSVCSIPTHQELTVGPKSVFISVAGQNVSYPASDEKVVTECEQGMFLFQCKKSISARACKLRITAKFDFADYYGQEAFTAYPVYPKGYNESSTSTIYCETCSAAQEACMDKWNSTSKTYSDSTCYDYSPCVSYTSPFKSNLKLNCTAVNRENEYCLSCVTGSTCSAPNGVTPVEPGMHVAVTGVEKIL
jgi:hypothetical protein